MASSKLVVLNLCNETRKTKLNATCRRDACQPAEITGFPPDFNSAGSLDSILNSIKKEEAHFRDASENALPPGIAENPAQAEAEDSSKIKDRLEALLFAETLQGTLSPNANPGKGSIGGLLNWMPKPPATIQRENQTLVHLSSVDLLYLSECDCARGE